MRICDNNITENSMADVMLVGHGKNAVKGFDPANLQGLKHVTNMIEAITASSQNSYSKIFVVMADFQDQLESALKTIRRIRCDAKIILLAQMFEEPKALAMLRSHKNPQGPVDDYYICPATLQSIIATEKTITQTVHDNTNLALLKEKDEKIKELETLVTQDDLTGLKNRRYVWEFLRQIIQQASDQNHNVTLLIFDIDNFKHYNDSYGHSVGDDVLKQAAQMMLSCSRQHDVTARIGGDEFAVVFWDNPKDLKKQTPEEERRSEQQQHPKESYVIAERFRKKVSSTKFSLLGSSGQGQLTISGGLATFPQDGKTAQELFEQADKAMLDAKRSGKNQIYLVGQPK
jgi:two-component system cell cycle response regulator